MFSRSIWVLYLKSIVQKSFVWYMREVLKDFYENIRIKNSF